MVGYPIIYRVWKHPNWLFGKNLPSTVAVANQRWHSTRFQRLGYFPGETVFEEMLAEDGLNDVQAGEGSVEGWGRQVLGLEKQKKPED